MIGIENLVLQKGLKRFRSISMGGVLLELYFIFSNVYKINLMFKMKIDGILWELAYFRNKIYDNNSTKYKRRQRMG